jgi:DNA polymerase II small subunit/DNA polymerase delta subunit B
MILNADKNHSVKRAVVLLTHRGFQLEVAALETLFEREDPREIVEKLIKKLEELPETPIFITKKMLDELKVEVKPQQEVIPQQKEEDHHSPGLKKMSVGAVSWRPIAKDVDAKVEIIVDPSEQLSSGGSIENFMDYIRDRYARLERILRRRMDVRGATSISDALNAPRGSDVKVIGMITEKRERGRSIFMEIEDREASTSVLVPLTIDRNKFQSPSCSVGPSDLCYWSKT